MSGPPPKPANQRRRRNAPAVATMSGVSDGEVRGPKLTGKHSALGTRFYEALQRSGQAQWFEASDWSAAELLVVSIDQYVSQPTAALLAAITSAQRGLLVTEADRRRAHVELTRPEPSPEAERDAEIASLAEYVEGRRRNDGA